MGFDRAVNSLRRRIRASRNYLRYDITRLIKRKRRRMNRESQVLLFRVRRILENSAEHSSRWRITIPRIVFPAIYVITRIVIASALKRPLTGHVAIDTYVAHQHGRGCKLPGNIQRGMLITSRRVSASICAAEIYGAVYSRRHEARFDNWGQRYRIVLLYFSVILRFTR